MCICFQELKTDTLDVLLEKPALGSLGLSLAKPPNTDGIFIRVIAPSSVAALDGRLKVGDRLWMVRKVNFNDQFVSKLCSGPARNVSTFFGNYNCLTHGLVYG